MAFEAVIDPPRGQLSDHGLLTGGAYQWIQDSAADWAVGNRRERWEMNGFLFNPYPCDLPRGFDPACEPTGVRDNLSTPAGGSKGFVRVKPAWWEATDVCELALVQSGGIDLAERASYVVGLGLQPSLENELWAGAVAGLQDSTLINAPTVLNGGAAVSPQHGLALLEEALGRGLGGRGTIHAPTAVVNTWWSNNGILDEVGPRIETHTKGHYVIAGDGYPGLGPATGTAPGGTIPTPNTYWVYATGLITVRTGPVTVYDPTEDTRQYWFTRNAAYGTALQAGAVWHDNCRKYAVLVDLANTSGTGTGGTGTTSFVGSSGALGITGTSGVETQRIVGTTSALALAGTSGSFLRT